MAEESKTRSDSSRERKGDWGECSICGKWQPMTDLRNLASVVLAMLEADKIADARVHLRAYLAASSEGMKPRCPKCGNDGKDIGNALVLGIANVKCWKCATRFELKHLSDMYQFFALSPARSGEPPKQDHCFKCGSFDPATKLSVHAHMLGNRIPGWQNVSDVCSEPYHLAARPSEPSAPQANAEHCNQSDRAWPCPNCGCNHFRGENTLCNDGVPQAEPPKEEKP